MRSSRNTPRLHDEAPLAFFAGATAMKQAVLKALDNERKRVARRITDASSLSSDSLVQADLELLDGVIAIVKDLPVPSKMDG